MKRHTMNSENQRNQARTASRSHRWMPTTGLAGLLLLTAALAQAQTRPLSPGCDAINAGAWDIAFNNSTNFWHDFPGLTFAPGERVRVTLTSTASPGRLAGTSFRIVAGGYPVLLQFGTEVAPFPTTDFTGEYTFSGAGDLTPSADIASSAISTNVLRVTCDLDPCFDVTPPDITWAFGPDPDASYVYGSVPAAPTCTADDAESGPVACTVVGYTSDVGTHTMVATATDLAGNVATEQRTYTVSPWTLAGFHAPVVMNGALNLVKSGQVVPLKFNVFAGPTEVTDVAEVQAFTWAEAVSCSALDELLPGEPVQEVTSGATALRYDLETRQFVQNWQTPRFKVGTCYRVTMTTADASSLEAFFELY